MRSRGLRVAVVGARAVVDYQVDEEAEDAQVSNIEDAMPHDIRVAGRAWSAKIAPASNCITKKNNTSSVPPAAKSLVFGKEVAQFLIQPLHVFSTVAWPPGPMTPNAWKRYALRQY